MWPPLRGQSFQAHRYLQPTFSLHEPCPDSLFSTSLRTCQAVLPGADRHHAFRQDFEWPRRKTKVIVGVVYYRSSLVFLPWLQRAHFAFSA